MATQDQLPEGRFQCYLRSPALRFYELKVIVPLMIDVGGEQIEHDQFMNVDGTAKTAKGKLRAEFTRDALETLGASDPMTEIADAIEAGKGEVTITMSGAPQWVECVIAHSGGYVDVNVYKPRVTADAGTVKKAASGLRSLGARGKAKAPEVNPFAPPARGTPIAPPGARPAPIAPPVARQVPTPATPNTDDAIPF